MHLGSRAMCHLLQAAALILCLITQHGDPAGTLTVSH